MLDRLNTKILKVLNSQCDGSSYKVLEIEDVVSSLPKYKLNAETLKQNLDYLQERNFLDIKFFDNNEVCLTVLPKGRLHSEEVLENKKTAQKYIKLAIIASIGCGIMAFIGAFLAILIIK